MIPLQPALAKINAMRLDDFVAPREIARRTLQPRLAAANINPETFLATDYLNHLNEAVMLLELAPDAPELLDELTAWTPRSYTEHFRASGFHMRDLACLAYELAPDRYRIPFDFIARVAARRIRRGISDLLTGVVHVGIHERAAESAAAVRRLIGVAAAIINGREVAIIRGRIVQSASWDDEPTMAQADIDGLFSA